MWYVVYLHSSPQHSRCSPQCSRCSPQYSRCSPQCSSCSPPVLDLFSTVLDRSSFSAALQALFYRLPLFGRFFTALFDQAYLLEILIAEFRHLFIRMYNDDLQQTRGVYNIILETLAPAVPPRSGPVGRRGADAAAATGLPALLTRPVVFTTLSVDP